MTCGYSIPHFSTGAISEAPLPSTNQGTGVSKVLNPILTGLRLAMRQSHSEIVLETFGCMVALDMMLLVNQVQCYDRFDNGHQGH